MKVLSLFSGIGGLDAALPWAPTYCVEADPFCRAVLRRHYPEAIIADDVRTFPYERGMADIIVGGFPCQGISEAGRREGLSDPRSGLWWEMLRAIRLVGPAYVLMENVEAIRRRGLGDVLGSLAEGGYDAEWDCVPAAHAGAPHARDRWFSLAYPSSLGLQGRNPAVGLHHATDAGQARGSELAGGRQLLRSVGGPTWWSTEPGLGRVVHGPSRGPDWKYRIQALGNAVIPYQAEAAIRILTGVEC